MRWKAADVFDVQIGGEELVVISMPSEPADSLRELSPAQREVALAAASGDSNAAIARRRRCSPRTIANQLAAVYRKLGIASRAELAALLFGKP